MTVILFILGLFQCFAIWLLGRRGLDLQARAAREQELALCDPPNGWPPCAVIVPASGAHPAMESALRSLAEQDYPDYSLCLVTASADDAACELISRLKAEYPAIEHVIAGTAQTCGQKNQSQLAGVASAGKKAAIYIFCDSTHIARPSFLRCLAAPICRGEAEFTTGYHEVEPHDQGIITLAYAISVLFMRFMQGLPKLAQPWGGAMAMSREAYERCDVGSMWSENVVDDCSLAALLAREGARVRLCPGAILRTWTARHPLHVWRAWLERQILFLKFCMRGEWLALSLVCAIMAIPPIWFAAACCRGMLGFGSGMAPFLALCWLCAIWYAIGGWRSFLPEIPATSRWLRAFFCACFMFAYVYLGTIFKRTLVWRNITYHVGPGGRVLGIKRESDAKIPFVKSRLK